MVGLEPFIYTYVVFVILYIDIHVTYTQSEVQISIYCTASQYIALLFSSASFIECPFLQ